MIKTWRRYYGKNEINATKNGFRFLLKAIYSCKQAKVVNKTACAKSATLWFIRNL